MNDGYSCIVDIDLAKLFDIFDHDKLMTIFGRAIKDGDVISVVRKFPTPKGRLHVKLIKLPYIERYARCVRDWLCGLTFICYNRIDK